MDENAIFRIQKELVDEKSPLQETSAGQCLLDMCVAAEKECSKTLDRTATSSLEPGLAETILGLKRELVGL